MSDATPGRDVGEEARKLLESVQEWAKRTMPAPPDGHPGPECQWCPLCQLASVLRGEHPELTERFAETGTVVLGALRSLVDAAGASAAETPRPSARPVQHVDLGEPGTQP